MSNYPPLPEAATQDCRQLCSHLAYADLQLKKWTDVVKDLKERLTRLNKKGEVPTKFAFDQASFSLQQGRATLVLDAASKLQMERIKQLAIDSGSAIYSEGSPYWTIRQKKS